jgi:Uma2 family endonuclease
MSITKLRLTEAEFLRLPDDGRKYELVHGEVKEVPTGYYHDEIVAELIGLMRPHAKLKGRLASSNAGFRMRNGNIRCPDVSFVLIEHLPKNERPEGFLSFAPDLVVEIVSPYDDPRELDTKIAEYFESGTQLIWVLYPKHQTVRVYLSPDDFQDYQPDDEIDGGDLLSGFRCRVRDLFEF